MSCAKKEAWTVPGLRGQEGKPSGFWSPCSQKSQEKLSRFQSPCSQKSQEGKHSRITSPCSNSSLTFLDPLSQQYGGFTAVEFLGSGCFGEVWRGISETKGEVAMKFEQVRDPSRISLPREVETLNALWKDSLPQGVVQLFHFEEALVASEYNCIVMEKLGENLRECLNSCGGKFTLQTTVLIADQILQRIEYLHSKGIMHRDIKPSNFMFGIGRKIHHVYLIDFGLSKAYWNGGNFGKGKHISAKTGYKVGGTPRYLSINGHKGKEQSRRDDLESLGYMFIHFLKGKLPWCELDSKEPDYFQRLATMKKDACPEQLCQGAPPTFAEYLTYSRNLVFKQRPNYDKLLDLLRSCRLPGTRDHDYEWKSEFESEELEPLQERSRVNQPDDYQFARPKCAHTTGNLFSFLWPAKAKVTVESHCRNMLISQSLSKVMPSG